MVSLSSLLWGSPAKGTPPTPQQPVTATTTPTPAPSSIATTPALQVPQAADSPPVPSSMLSRRSFKQLGLFFGGATLLGLSVLVSRRAVIRHSVSSRLRFYQTNMSRFGASNGKDKRDRDPMVAVEALNLATLNVVSFGIMLTGGMAFAFDISSVEELRAKARRTLFEGTGDAEMDAAAEREVAEWVSKVLKIQIPQEKGENSTSDAAAPSDKTPK